MDHKNSEMINKILDAEYKQAAASLDNVIRICEKLNVEVQHQIKKLIQNYEQRDIRRHAVD
jgi:hypothetical protein